MSVDISIHVGARVGYSRASALGQQLIQERMEQIRIEIREFILVSWPVETATSLQGWELRVGGSWLYIRNQIDYAEHVHRAGESVLVWTEIEAFAEQQVSAAEADLREIVADHPAAARVESRAPGLSGTAAVVSALFRARERVLSRLTRDEVRGRIRDVRDPTRRRPRTMLEMLRG